MAVITDEQLDAAEARGQALLDAGPRAQTARYERTSRRVVIDLVNGCTFSIPTDVIEDLREAGDDALADLIVDGAGLNLHWAALDVDLFVPALLSGTFGTKAWMSREMARLAGQSTSAKKAAAARANGIKGGRPRKSA